MSSLIRHGDLTDAAVIRPLDFASPPQGPGFDSEVSLELFARDPQLLERDQEIAALRKALAEAEQRYDTGMTAAREQGRLEAEKAYRRDEEAALATLKEGLSAVLQKMDQQLASSNDLALLLCETALAKIFSRPKNQRELITQAIERQIEALRLETVVRLNVSATDFPEQATLDSAVRSIASGRIEAHRDPQLPPGSFRIDLRLGHIELSLPQHWEALKALFRRLSDRSEGA